MPIVAVAKPLREKLGDDGVDALVELINESITEQKNAIIAFVEEKFVRRLAEVIGKLETRLLDRMSEIDRRLTGSIAETKAELIKWMFIFWVGQVAVMLGILFVFFK